MKILVINAGSSSLKYQLIDMENEQLLAKGLCERIGIDGHLKHTPLVGGKPVFNEDISLPTHSEAIAAVIDKLTSAEYGVVSSMKEIDAVGHRVVHGGEKFASSVLITDEVMDALKECTPFAPLHNPANITGINACKAVMGDVPMVAVFDTAFHQTMPPKAYMFGMPYECYEQFHVRKYGFHGTSHRFVSMKYGEVTGKSLEGLNIVSCHLGNGSSITAIKDGKSVDTSMGFTPLDGIIMGTRSGSVDPSAVEFVQNKLGFTPAQMSDYLNKKSGFLGLSGQFSDNRDITSAAQHGDKRSQLVTDMLTYEIKKYIGSYTAAMNGLDVVIFTGGIGENAPEVRKGVCENMEYLGIKLDNSVNDGLKGKLAKISAPDSKVEVWVIPTNEELLIARDTLEITGLDKNA